MVLNGVNYKDGKIYLNDKVLNPKNDLSKDIVLGFYKVAESAIKEGGVIIDDVKKDSNSDSHSYTILAENDAMPKLNIVYLNAKRNYIATLILNNKPVKVSGLESVIKQVSDNLKNPNAKVKEKSKSKRMHAIESDFYDY